MATLVLDKTVDSNQVRWSSLSRTRVRGPTMQQTRQILDNLSPVELAYEKSLQQTEFLYQEESARRLRVQILLLRDRNDSLHNQLAQENNRTGELTKIGQDLRAQLHISRNSLENLQGDLRLKSREIETLKVGRRIARAILSLGKWRLTRYRLN